MATFGYTIIATDTASSLSNTIAGSAYNLSVDGDATTITARLFNMINGDKTKCAIYDSSLNLVAVTEERNDMEGEDWYVFNLVGSPVFLAAGDYTLMAWSDGGSTMRRDTDAGVDRWFFSDNYDGLFPATISASDRTGKFSIYCTYEEPAAGTNMQINISDAWKTVDAMQINIGDVWKTVAGAQINIGDAWKTIY